MNRDGVLAMLEAGLPYRSMLERLAGKILRNSSEVDEVLQQVHVSVWQDVDAGLEIRDLEKYLKAATRNACRTFMRAAARRRQVERAAGLEARERYQAQEIALGQLRDHFVNMPPEVLEELGVTP